MKPRPSDGAVDELPIDSIRIGKRYRQHMGDIGALANSIAEHGLMHAIVVTPERDLVAGERRLAAVRQLGWTSVPVRVVTPADLLKAETDENRVRVDFTASEAVAIAAALRPTVEAAAITRETLGQVATGSKGRTRDQLAAAVGMSGRTLEKATAVVVAAEADPEFGAVVAEMDATGNVERAFRKVTRPGADPMAMNDVHRAKFPELAYTQLAAELTRDLRAFAKPTAWVPEEWADRLALLRSAEIAAIRQQTAWVRKRIDAWDALVDRPALTVIERTAP